MGWLTFKHSIRQPLNRLAPLSARLAARFDDWLGDYTGLKKAPVDYLALENHSLQSRICTSFLSLIALSKNGLPFKVLYLASITSQNERAEGTESTMSRSAGLDSNRLL